MPPKEFDPRFVSEGKPDMSQPATSVTPETPPTLEPVSVPGSPNNPGTLEKAVGMEVKPETGESILPPPPPAPTSPESDSTEQTNDAAPLAEVAPASASSMTSVTSIGEAAKVIEDLNLRRNAENGLESDVSERVH